MPKNVLVGQKFKVGDKVYRKNIFGTTLEIGKIVGTIYGVFTKKIVGAVLIITTT